MNLFSKFNTDAGEVENVVICDWEVLADRELLEDTIDSITERNASVWLEEIAQDQKDLALTGRAVNRTRIVQEFVFCLARRRPLCLGRGVGFPRLVVRALQVQEPP